ncbi:hypothetical protein F5B20DRAFT_547651 [Whalleya microplaca]|nr:hypothetical protein F5B20DRAFT_547651 [Whalleya microplaca]
MRPTKLIATFRRFPKELFRVNDGRQIKLRVWSPQRREVYDIFAENGRVEPKALNHATYVAPNGASMRPNSPYQQALVSWRFKSQNMVVFGVPEGTELPEDLLLVHERSDHYSLQPARSMTIDDLNGKISLFMAEHARVFNRDQWMKAYPKATEDSNFPIKRRSPSNTDPDNNR